MFLRSLDRATLEYLAFYALPAILICVLLVWRVLDTDLPPKEPPLRITLLRNVLHRPERRPPVPVELNNVFRRRWDGKKSR
jgi:hypothetical protein